MAEAETVAQTTDDVDKPAKDAAQLAKKWIAEIQAAEKAQSKWVERAKKIEKIYADKRDSKSDRQRKFNILWSNVETLRPAVYMQTPKARAERRYRDRDPEARFGALLLERGVETSCELYDFDHAMDQAVRDRLVVGRGQCWVFYMPNIVGDEQDQALAYEDVQADYVCWPDFLHSVSRTWGEVWWVGRWFYKSRSELKTWGRERGLEASKIAKVAMDVAPEGDKTDEGLKDERARARILEVWNKRDGEVLYVAPGSGVRAILGQMPPPVKFRDFFPCPRPMLATTTADSLVPTPDYAQYQDQAEELNRLTDRIAVLTKALKVVGVYASESGELAQMIEAGDNRMIPVKNWAMFAEGGGAKNKIEWFPVEVVAEVLKGLHDSFEVVLRRIYEISGISDILRGATDPDETATAQGIKSKWGSLRVRRVQKDTQRFAADIARLKAEVIAEQFAPKSILNMAGVDDDLLSKYAPTVPPPPVPPEMQEAAQQNPAIQQQLQALHKQAQDKANQEFVAKVLAMLKDDTARNFRIDVETDSTLEPDVQEEKQTAVEFATAISAFLKEAAPLMMTGGPEVAKMLGEVLLFVVRRFGKDVDQLEKTIEQLVEAASQPKPPQPDPEMEKAKAQIQVKREELEMKKEEHAMDRQHEQDMHQLDMGAKLQEVQIDGQIKQQEAEQKRIMGEQQMAISAAQGEQAIRAGEHKMSIEERKAQMQRDTKEGGPPQ